MLSNKERMKLKEIQEKKGGKDILLDIILMDYTDSPELAQKTERDLKDMISKEAKF